MIPYILHVSILIAAGVLFYKLLLKRLTFYALNRWILLTCLGVAFVLPMLPVPWQWSWQGRVVAVSSQVAAVELPPSKQPVAQPAKQQVDQPVTPGHAVFIKQAKDVPALLPKQQVQQPVQAREPVLLPTVRPEIRKVAVDNGGGGRRILEALFYLYLFGVVVLGLNMLRQMVLLLLQAYRGPVVRDGNYRIITAAGIHSPCSFGKFIFIHPHRYDPDTYHQILLHEKIHAGGWHTVDILLAELGVIFQWFNPFIWLFRREMENNLEFLTDRNVLKSPEVERLAYQLSLVKVAAPDLPLSITSNYNQSLLKKRIIMMNTQNSARHSAWKYVFLLPLFIFLAAALNRPVAQVRHNKGNKPPAPPATVVAPAPAPVPTAPVPAVQAPVVTVQSTVVDPEIDVRVSPVTVPAVPSPAPAPMADTSKPSSRPDRTEGSWFITSGKQDEKDDKVRIELRDQDGDHQWNNSFSVPRSQLSALSGVGKVEFTLVREAGTMHFSGQFDGEQGFGHYKFQPDADYLAHMRQKKIQVEEGDVVTFFLVDIKKGYVDMLQSNGFPDISRSHLISMAALGIDEAYIRGVRESGFANISENHLITFKALHIDKDVVEDLRKAGYDHLSEEKIITFKSLKIDGAYLRGFPASTPPQDIITYKSLRIDSEYLAMLKREGYGDLSSHEIVSLRSLNVTPEFIRGFKAIGYKDIPAHKLVSLKSLNVTPDYIKGFQVVGFTDISLDNLVSMKSLGITPEYVKGFLDIGYKDITPNHLASLRSMNITPEFIRDFNAIGFKNIPLNQLTSLKAMGVTPAYVTKMKEKGFVSDDLNRYIRLKNAFD